jgi:hypothetical protein
MWPSGGPTRAPRRGGGGGRRGRAGGRRGGAGGGGANRQHGLDAQAHPPPLTHTHTLSLSFRVLQPLNMKLSFAHSNVAAVAVEGA